MTFEEDIRQAVKTLREGGLILYPTDTVWGIGCDATRPEAVSKVYELKKRADSKALIVLVNRVEDLDRYVDEVPPIALDLIEVADRPMTIVYERGRNLAKNLLAEDGSVGIRVTGEEYSSALCKALRRPVVSSSANLSGEPAPSFFAQIPRAIIEGVDYVASYRRDDSTPRRSSSVVKVGADSTIQILRK